MKSLFAKIYFGYILLLIFIAGILGLYFFNILDDNYQRKIEDNLRNINFIVQEKFKDIPDSLFNDSLQIYIKELGNNFNYRVTLINFSGEVLADSHKDYLEMENHKNRPEIIKAYNNESAFVRRYSKTTNKEMIYLAMPLINKNKETKAVLRLSIFSDKMSQILSSLSIDLLSVTFFVLLIALIIAYFITKKIIYPLKELLIASNSIAGGSFDINIKSSGDDEIGKLTDSFNLMAKKLNEYFSKVSNQKDELNTIISSIEDGLVVIDSNNRIVYFNKSFIKLMGDKAVIGSHFTDFINSESFNKKLDLKEIKKLIKDVRLYDKSLTFNFESQDKFFLANVYNIKSKNEIVLLFHDLTELKNIDKIKKDFIINVSHELRTPLTAIKGFAETLESELHSNDKALRYVEIINRHTNRLISLVNDLLSLAEIEKSDEIRLELIKFDLEIVIEDVLKIFEQKIKSKNLELKINIEQNLVKIKADKYKIEQVLVNLINNAINYTEEGKIEIKVFQKSLNLIIEISDTGIGIPKQEYERIFERFYMVDKSRSQKIGSTGLGLSIVKHIVNSHKGSIKVKSKINVGTTIIIKLPIDPNQIEV